MKLAAVSDYNDSNDDDDDKCFLDELSELFELFKIVTLHHYGHSDDDDDDDDKCVRVRRLIYVMTTSGTQPGKDFPDLPWVASYRTLYSFNFYRCSAFVS